MRNLANIITGGESPGLSPRSPTPKGARAEDVPEDVKSTWKALTIIVLGVRAPPPWAHAQAAKLRTCRGLMPANMFSPGLAMGVAAFRLEMRGWRRGNEADWDFGKSRIATMGGEGAGKETRRA